MGAELMERRRMLLSQLGFIRSQLASLEADQQAVKDMLPPLPAGVTRHDFLAHLNEALTEQREARHSVLGETLRAVSNW